MSVIFEWVLWSSVTLLVMVTVGYPMLLAVTCSLTRRRAEVAELASPASRVVLVVAAYNEEAVIARKLENCLQLDYPRDKLEIVVASDGSTDRTEEIVKTYAARGIVLAKFPRTGKTGMQNRVARSSRGDILVFSDANALYRPDAIQKLVRHFAAPSVGGVCGQLVYRVREAAAGRSERLYWDYEKFMKLRESALSSVVGANGSIYAVRRSDYVPIDEGLISDLVEPLALVRSGKRVVYEPDAISEEEPSASYGIEFRRKVRILTRSILGLFSMRELLNPLRFGIFSVQLIMHKLLRFLTPLFLILAGVSLTGLALGGRYLLVFAVTATGIAVALWVGRAMRSLPLNPLVRCCHLIYYYLMVNYALMLAWANVLRGRHMTLWSPERAEP
jgi:cellulose synthase/poly-beta-1,6-N-acetylglucosamine synthase-like glycosyltransferase